MTDPHATIITLRLIFRQARSRTASPEKMPTCHVSLLSPHGRRTFWWYVAHCPVCGRPHLGRARDLKSVTVTRQLPCNHWVAIAIARTDADSA
jgi:hypothetical protein